MRGAHRGRAHPRWARRGLASVYGFVMVFLLVIASLQAISVSLSAAAGAQAAAERASQVGQTRSLEHLRVGLSDDGNLTITNDGLIPSAASLLLVTTQSGSRTVPLQETIQVGSEVAVRVGTATSVAVVTALGDVFSSSWAASRPPTGARALADPVGGPGVDAQLYANPDYPSRFFMSEGTSAFEFSTLTGTRGWSFDAGEGEVTDILPLSGGTVFVSDGYYGDQFSSNLYALGSSGDVTSTYSMRLLRLYTTIETQFPNNGQPPYPVGSEPVQKGADSTYAYYDGWFLSENGTSSTTVPSDNYDLAASDADHIYLYVASQNPGGFGCTQPRGNLVTFYAYATSSAGVALEWSSMAFLNVCNLYPDALIASSAGSGLLVALFTETYWSEPNYYGGPYEGANPFIAVLTSSGTLLRSGNLDSNGYTSAATDGTNVYLAIPSRDQVEVLSASGGGGTFHDVGIPASHLVWAYGSLFAISASEVEVFSSTMSLKRTIDFAPLTLYSLSNSKPLEPQMVSPSFLILNSTSYVSLLRNSTGYGSLVMGNYSP